MSQSIVGEYSLQGVPEMAAGFRFTADGQYQFRYSYGAVDRWSQGTYTLSGQTITLRSDKVPGQDMVIKRQEKRSGDITIQVDDPNPYLKTYAVAIYGSTHPYTKIPADKDGRIRIPAGVKDKIYVMHELYPDIPTLIRDVDNPNTYFEIQLSPSLEQVTFQGIEFRLEDDILTCYPNSLMPFENIRFYRED